MRYGPMEYNLITQIHHDWTVWDDLRQRYDNDNFYPLIRLLTTDGGLTYSEILDMPLPILKGYTDYTLQVLQKQRGEVEKARRKRK